MRRLLVPGAFAVVALATGRGAATAVVHAAGSGELHSWLTASYQLLRMGVALAFTAFTIGRAEPHRRARAPLALAACAAAVAIPIGLAAPSSTAATWLTLAGEAVAVAACAWLLYSVLALGRCFGVLPEARGLVTDGPYRLVRHPVYLGELGACAGLALAAPAAVNLLLLALLGAAQAVRMSFEERALTDAFPTYADYAARTPRLLPRVGAATAAFRSDPPVPPRGAAEPDGSTRRRARGARALRPGSAASRGSA